MRRTNSSSVGPSSTLLRVTAKGVVDSTLGAAGVVTYTAPSTNVLTNGLVATSTSSVLAVTGDASGDLIFQQFSS